MFPLGAAAPFFNDAVSSVVKDVKSSAGVIFGLKLVNTTSGTAYLQVFNKPAASVNLGTTAADFCIRLTANESIFIAMPVPIDVDGTGISIAGTSTATGAGPAAISVAAFYE